MDTTSNRYHIRCIATKAVTHSYNRLTVESLLKNEEFCGYATLYNVQSGTGVGSGGGGGGGWYVCDRTVIGW